ncbi:hypothetical protein PJH48_29145, partial [Mycobacterium kansasii]
PPHHPPPTTEITPRTPPISLHVALPIFSQIGAGFKSMFGGMIVGAFLAEARSDEHTCDLQ